MKDHFRKLRIRISQIFGYAMVTGIVFSGSAWENINPLIGSLLFLTGVVLVAIASFGRLWCSLYIGGFKTRMLVVEGPYSICRNPLYFFSFLGVIGIGLATETFFFSVIAAVVFAVYYPLVIKAEESALEREHGKSFTAYVSTTPCFFPKLSLLQEPDTYVVNPKVFKKDLLQALWFIWAIGLLEVVEGLHALGIIPKIFHVY